MKKIILSSMLASLFLIGSAFMAPPAQVYDFHYVSPPETFTVTNTCNGENIQITQVTTEDFHVVINDNRVNLTDKYRYDITGVGDQGNTYHGTIIDNESANGISLQNGALTIIDNTHGTIVSNGSAPNLQINEQFKVTVTPDGKVSVFRDNASAKCLF